MKKEGNCLSEMTGSGDNRREVRCSCERGSGGSPTAGEKKGRNTAAAAAATAVCTLERGREGGQECERVAL